MEQAKNSFTILHFNDVYDLEERKSEPIGGAARFKTALNSFSHLDPMILFSGDLFEPSLLSTAYDGEQMIKPMNDFGVQVATFGNHEFSLELDMLTSYIRRANFPWLLSNVKSTIDNKPLAAGREWHTMHKNGLKFGFMGIAEEGWVRHIRTISQSLIVYEDFIDCARRLTKFLREEEKCDFVIALTHMGTANDTKLAKGFDGLDLILGGHDHLNMAEIVNGTYIIKSGSDFCEFNRITLKILDSACLDNLSTEDKQRIYKNRYLVDIEPVEITTKFEPDPEVKAHIDEHLKELNEKLKLPLFNSEVHLETRAKLVRSSEQNFPNLLTDIARLYSGTDVAVFNSGTYRGNVCFEPGIFTLRDVNIVLPWKDEIYKCEITGEQLYQLLENSVATLPAQNGRFLSVSGVKFAFDVARESQNRIEVSSIKVNGNPLDLTARYTLATNHYMIQGDFGYHMLREARMLHDKDDAEDIHTVLKKVGMLARDPHILEEHSKNVTGDPQKIVLPDSLSSPQKIAESHMMNLYYRIKPIIKDFVNIKGEWMISVAPAIEGRIVKL